MKGKIDDKGFLHIKRGKNFKKLGCPFLNAVVDDSRDGVFYAFCGDWCAKFGEPDRTQGVHMGRIYIEICNQQDLVFEEFEDER